VSDFGTHAFLTGLALTFGVSALVFVLTWLIALRVGRFNIVDVTWGLAFAAIAATSFLWSSGHGENNTRRLLVLVLTCLWGVRLAVYIGVRSRGHGEDPRYETMLSRAQGPRAVYALVIVFALQAVIAWFVSMPVQAAMYERSPVDALAWAGTAVWAVGVFFEAVGDAQLAAFKRDPANKGQVMDRGLWRYTRHPNYFGDACLWFGLWLITAQQWQGALTVLSPAVMGYFLSFKSGKPMLEKAMAASKPGYADYMRRTSGFFPMPPRRPLATDA
jgi:steroid 5-alpha reductase family enzyme